MVYKSAHYRWRQLNGFIAAVNEFKIELFTTCQTLVSVHKERESLPAQNICPVQRAYCAIVIAKLTKRILLSKNLALQCFIISYSFEQDSPFRYQFDFAGTNTDYTFIITEIVNQVFEPVVFPDKSIRVRRNKKFGFTVLQAKVKTGTVGITPPGSFAPARRSISRIQLRDLRYFKDSSCESLSTTMTS